MVKIKKVFVFMSILAAIFSLSCANTFAGELRKGTVRIVAGNEEVSACEYELVYNGHRYIPADYFVGGLVNALNEDEDLFYVRDVESYYYNASTTFYLSPAGYISFWGGSTKIRVGNWYDAIDVNLIYPAAMYDGIMYVSMEDVANVYDCYYGFDASVNTIYFY